MMLRVNGLFLDFNEDVEIERHAKIFEEIDETIGDYSYSFSIPKTSRNFKILGIQSIDISSKPIYNNVDCDLLDNDGNVVYVGLLRVERINEFIEASFFSGNYNWISKISGNITDLDFSEYDINLTEANIISSRTNTEGVVFPLLDIGGLITRSKPTLKVEDFSGCIYVKTIFKRIFQAAGIKLKGDLVNDFIYNNAIVCKNNKNLSEIDNRSVYAGNTGSQLVTKSADEIVAFQNDSVFPFYDGSLNNYDAATYTYTADVRMSIEVKASILLDVSVGIMIMSVSVNGSSAGASLSLNSDTISLSKIITLNAGDSFQIHMQYLGALSPATANIITATLNVKPKFVYTVLGVSTVPNWTKQDFVAQYLNLFNVVTDYDPISRELTCNFFDRIKGKTAVDISQHIEPNPEIDFEEFISNYGRQNMFKYDESEDEEIREYNITQFVKYGSGKIEIENDFIEEIADVVESDFKAPISYINGALDASIERINLIELDEDFQTDISTVTDSSGTARFNIEDDFYFVGDLVRIKDSSNSKYNGDYIVSSVGAGYIQLHGVPYDTNSTGKVYKLNYTYTDNDNVFLFINIPDYNVSNFSSISEIFLESSNYSSFAYAYFNLINQGRQVNEDYKQSLSFGAVENPLSYQRTLLNTYWSNFDNILNDPVKLKCIAHFPRNVFFSLTPLVPVFIKTEESSNLYYRNKITGYKNSYQPCQIELIKL